MSEFIECQVPKTMADDLRQRAWEDGQSMTDLIRDAVFNYLYVNPRTEYGYHQYAVLNEGGNL